MKPFLPFILALALVQTASAQVVLSPATQAEVNAGVNRSKYVTPATLRGIGATNVGNASTLSSNSVDKFLGAPGSSGTSRNGGNLTNVTADAANGPTFTAARDVSVVGRLIGDGVGMDVPLTPWAQGRTAPKPVIAFTTWWETLGTNTSQWSTNKAYYLYTNGVFAACQSVGAKLIFWFDDSLVKSTRSGGVLQVNTTNYPAGLNVVTAFIHSLGMLVGLYTSYNDFTCLNFAGTTRDHVEDDVKFFSGLGGDALKIDMCTGDPGDYGDLNGDPYHIMDMVLLFSHANAGLPYYNGYGTNLPMILDFTATWSNLRNPPYISVPVMNSLLTGANMFEDATAHIIGDDTTNVLFYLGRQTNYNSIHGEGHFTHLFGMNPMDVSTNCIAAQITAAAIAPAPIIIGGIFQSNLWCFTNREVLAIQQDDATTSTGYLAYVTGTFQVWPRRLASGDLAIAVYNTGAAGSVTVPWGAIGLSTNDYRFARDSWAQTDLGLFNSSFSLTVSSNGVRLIRLQVPNIIYQTANASQFAAAWAGLTMLSDSGSPHFWIDGRSLAGGSSGAIGLLFPAQATKGAVAFPVQVSGTSAWTNVHEPMYYLSSGRVYNSGGVANGSQDCTVTTGATNFISSVVSWPDTNAIYKEFRLTLGAGTNSNTRYVGTPIRLFWK